MLVIVVGGLKGYCSLKMGEGLLLWLFYDVINDVIFEIDIVNYSTFTYFNKLVDN